MYRELVQKRPEVFLPSLAASLTNLGNMLAEVGKAEEALAATIEGSGYYRSLAQQKPGNFLSSLAMSLNNLGSRLWALDRKQEAKEAIEEALILHRRLAAAAPCHALDLIRSLGARGSMLFQEEDHGAAISSFQEALQLLLPLAVQDPQAHKVLLSTLARDCLYCAKAGKLKTDEVLLGEIFRLV